MPTKVIMPQLGESVVEGTIIEWIASEGDQVEEYDPILVIGTDKVDSDIPAPASGTLLKIYVQAGETVEAGTLLAVIGVEGDSLPDADDYQAAQHNGNGQHEEAPSPAPVQTAAAPTETANVGHVTPVVARMVAAHNLDLSRIQGTGHDGRITKKDVEVYLAQQDESAFDDTSDGDIPPWEQPGSGDLFKSTADYELGDEDIVQESVPRPSPIPPQASSPAIKPADGDLPGELVKLSSMRRAIAEHMVRSKLHTSPHVSTIFEIDMTAVMKHRDANKAAFERQGGRLTFTPYFVAASVKALREYPVVNARWMDEGLFYYHDINVGMAVAIDDGLIVPVIRNAQDLNLVGLARQVNDLAHRARNRQLKPDEVKNGTFTITNHGVSGSLFATPIINQPQVAILGVGKLEKRVKVIDDAIAIRPCLYLSLTFDHRVIDGAAGDGFLAAIKDTLENWS